MIRNEFDTLKVFATILVVIGHISILYTTQGAYDDIQFSSAMTLLTKGIYLFHMPLFIALSGAIYMLSAKKGKYNSFLPFIINKTKRIIVPYLFIGTCCLLPTLILLYNISITSCLSDMYIGGGMSKHLWFLGAIFWCFLFFWIIERLHLNHRLTFVISLIIVIVYSKYVCNNMFQLQNGLGALPSFIFGAMLVDNPPKTKSRAMAFNVLIIAVLKLGIAYMPNAIIVQLFCMLLPYPIIMILYVVFRSIHQYVMNNKWISFILKYSFPIYLFHVECIYIIYYYLRNSVPHSVLIPLTFFVSIAVSILLAMIFKRLKLQFLLGEK